MKAIFAALISIRGLSGLVGALLLSTLIWLFAPALLGTESLVVRILLTAVPIVVWLVVLVVLVMLRQKRDAALISGATETAERSAKADAATLAAAEEERVIGQRLTEALGAMKSAAGAKGNYLYERPWYVIIGPPGSGKTTAIQNSGLDFPLVAGRVAGVGGTRNCDWWIAEQAVLIDTAGRYTTQDSDAGADKAGWERFLDLLRRERPRQPLNGVIVAFGADMLSRLDADGRQTHALAVRRRVSELEQKLGQKLPVYFLVSKVDLVVGFTEFFDDLDREARSQVWGMTFPAEWRQRAMPGRSATSSPACCSACRSACSSACRPSADPSSARASPDLPPSSPRSKPCSRASSRPRSAGPSSTMPRSCAASTSPRAPRRAPRSIG